MNGTHGNLLYQRHCIYYYPDWECLDDFIAIKVEKFLAWLGMEPTTLALSQVPLGFGNPQKSN